MKSYQVASIGDAVVDVISQCDDNFLSDQGIEKGSMQLICRDRGESLYEVMGNRVQTPGGSVANTIAGIGALGLETAFIGRVQDDALGCFYAESMTEEGIDFVNSPALEGDLPTSRSMIFVSPDGERSMNTYLGISAEMSSADVPAGVAGNTQIMLLEGYLFDKDKGKEAFRKAAQMTKAAGGQAGIALSDPSCVDRHRADFLDLIDNELDFVISNEAEIKALFETDNLDTTGAGDQFAAGFLFGLATNRDLETCARIGCVCAREVISHIGPRPRAEVLNLLKDTTLV